MPNLLAWPHLPQPSVAIPDALHRTLTKLLRYDGREITPLAIGRQELDELEIQSIDHFHSHCLGRFCFQPAKGKRVEYRDKWPLLGPVCLKILHAIQWNPGVYLSPRELVDLTGIKSLLNPGVLTARVMKLREAHGEKGTPHFIQSNVAGAFFAFDRDGYLLFTTLPSPPPPEVKKSQLRNKTAALRRNAPAGFEFGPGACLLCRVLGDAGEYPDLARSADIRPGSAGSWLIVTPIDQLQPTDHRTAASTIAPRLIGSGGIALVPRYLIQALSDGGCEALCCVNFSRHIRYPEDPPQPKPILSGKGHTTHVLPDHVRAGHWSCVNERFPSDSSFLLCSDGFYSAFDDPRKMWLWLTDHEAALRHPRQQQTVLRQLHEHLHQTTGDDDISMIWVSGTQLMAGQGGEVDDGC